MAVANGDVTSSMVEWELHEDQDAFFDDFQPKEYSVATPADLERCKADCLALGYGGFVVRRDKAWLRPNPREEILERKSWRSKATLYVSPEPHRESSDAEGAVTIEYSAEHGPESQVASAEVLAANSGYFASVFRHSWSDGENSTQHRLCLLPGGDMAWAFASPWLATAPGYPIGHPWPVLRCEDVEQILLAAAYLDAARLLRAAVRSWRLSGQRTKDEILRVAACIVETASQFSGEDSDGVMDELRSLLQELPRHQLQLSQEFLGMPAAGLAILDTREAASVSLLAHVGNTVRSAAAAITTVFGKHTDKTNTAEAEEKAQYTPHEFAIRLFEAHQLYFCDHVPALRRLLRYVDPQREIPVPLCFKIAAAAASAAQVDEAEVFAGERLAVDILQTGLSSAVDPAQAASHEDCVVGLFGAWCSSGRGAASGGGMEDVGEVRRAGPQVVLELDVLARPCIPPAASAVILSRVLSSWGAVHDDGKSNGKAQEQDPAAVILAGVATDRQGLRRMLTHVLPLIAEEQSLEMGTEWGSSFDYAVPELRAAFMHAASVAMKSGASGRAIADDSTLRLLFRIVYQPSGGLQGVPFPHVLLQELRPHNGTCQAMVAMRVLHEWQAAAHEDLSKGFALAQDLWSVVRWDSVDVDVIERTIKLFRDWLTDAKFRMPSDERAKIKAVTVQLLLSLPVRGLQNPEELFGPPIPSHFLATLAYRESQRTHDEISSLQAENSAMRIELARLRDSSRSG